MEICAECGKPAYCNPDTDCCAPCERAISEAAQKRKEREHYQAIARRNNIRAIEARQQ